MVTCTRCQRLRDEKRMSRVKVASGKKQWRCKAKSVCSSIARRKRLGRIKGKCDD